MPDGRGKTKALTLGAEAAAAIVALRQNDGTEVDLFSSDFTPGTQPGDYQFVPPYDFTLAKDFRYATPFGLESPEQFRVPAPPALTSRRYARAYMALYDSYVAGWDSKFHWDLWRPYTAIRAGDTDGNRRTARDATWLSYLETPPVQDYPSTHSTLGAGAAEVLKRSFGTDRVPFSMDSSTALPASPVRSFVSFTQAADENADSRVRAGIHFRFSTEQGKALGRRVGSYIDRHHLQRR